jgi:hypothetical protein
MKNAAAAAEALFGVRRPLFFYAFHDMDSQLFKAITLYLLNCAA